MPKGSGTGQCPIWWGQERNMASQRQRCQGRKARPTHVWSGRLSLCSSWPSAPAAPTDTCQRSLWESSCLGSLVTCPAGLKQEACGHDGPQVEPRLPHTPLQRSLAFFSHFKMDTCRLFFQMFVTFTYSCFFCSMDIGFGVLVVQGESSAPIPAAQPCSSPGPAPPQPRPTSAA